MRPHNLEPFKTREKLHSNIDCLKAMLKFQLHNGNGRTLGFSLGCPIQSSRDAYYLRWRKIIGWCRLAVPQIPYSTIYSRGAYYYMYKSHKNMW